MFNLYLEARNRHCNIIRNLNGDSFAQCDEKVDIKQFPDVIFNMDKVALRLKASDVFDKIIGGGLNGKIFIVEFSNVWVFNMVILKNYDIFFDDQNIKIGFKENHLFENVNKENYNDEKELNFQWFNFGILIACFIVIGFFVATLWWKKKMFVKQKKKSKEIIEQMPYKIILSQNLLNDIK